MDKGQIKVSHVDSSLTHKHTQEDKIVGVDFLLTDQFIAGSFQYMLHR